MGYNDRNLRAETITILAGHGKQPADVKWVGSEDGSIAFDWERFAVLADRTYDPGFGSAEVSPLLIVVGDGWWLERDEYDGSEWWKFKELPTRKPDALGVETVFVFGYSDPMEP